MKRVTILTLLLMAFVSFATMESFADNSPPGVGISISYELPQGIDVNFESQDAQVWQVLQKAELKIGDRIAVNDCDLNLWPSSNNAINIYTSKFETGIFCNYDGRLESEYKIHPSYTENASNQYRLSVNVNEVLSLFYNSNGVGISARNEIT